MHGEKIDLVELDLLFIRKVNILKHRLLLVIVDFLYTDCCQRGSRRKPHIWFSTCTLSCCFRRFLVKWAAHRRPLMQGISWCDSIGHVVNVEWIYNRHWSNIYGLSCWRPINVIYWFQLYLLKICFLLRILGRWLICSVQSVTQSHYWISYFKCCAWFLIRVISWWLDFTFFDFVS